MQDQEGAATSKVTGQSRPALSDDWKWEEGSDMGEGPRIGENPVRPCGPGKQSGFHSKGNGKTQEGSE